MLFSSTPRLPSPRAGRPPLRRATFHANVGSSRLRITAPAAVIRIQTPRTTEFLNERLDTLLPPQEATPTRSPCSRWMSGQRTACRTSSVSALSPSSLLSFCRLGHTCEVQSSHRITANPAQTAIRHIRYVCVRWWWVDRVASATRRDHHFVGTHVVLARGRQTRRGSQHKVHSTSPHIQTPVDAFEPSA